MDDRILPGLTSAFLVSALMLASCGNDDGGAMGSAQGTEGAAQAGSGTGEPSGVDDGDAADDEAAGGAGESDEPQDEPTPVPASSDGPAENWPEPEKPEEMFVEDQAGAEAAIAYWWEVYNYARLTGEVELLDAISDRECIFCGEQAELFSEVHDRGGWYVSDPDVVVEAYARVEDDGTATVIYLLDQGEFTAYLPNGEILGVVEGKEEVNWTASLDFSDGQWVVSQVAVFGYEGDER